jgi:hypothetical protein
VKQPAVVPEHGANRTPAQQHRVPGNRLEDGLDIRRRGADRPQDVARRRLLLERLLGLVEQPDVLDGDDRLGGKSLEEGHLPVREGLRLGAPEPDRANRDAFSHQRDAEDRAVAPVPRTLAALGKLVRLRLDVSDMDGPPLQHRSASHGPSVQREGILADPSAGDRTVMGDEAEPFAVEAENGSV